MDRETHAAHGLAHHIAGFVICIFLTAIPFAVVLGTDLHTRGKIIVILFAGVAQLFVQLHFFLRIGLSSLRKDNGITFVFVGVLVLIMIGGTLWIMTDLGRRMMG